MPNDLVGRLGVLHELHLVAIGVTEPELVRPARTLGDLGVGRHPRGNQLLARSNGCKIIAVTSDAALRERMADVSSLLLCPIAESARGKIATYYAQTCLRYALECLHGECFSLNYEKSVQQVTQYDDNRPGISPS